MIESLNTIEFVTGLAWGALAADTIKKTVQYRLQQQFSQDEE